MGSAFLPIIPNFLRDVTVVLAKSAELSEGGVAGAVNEIGSSVVEFLAFGLFWTGSRGIASPSLQAVLSLFPTGKIVLATAVSP